MSEYTYELKHPFQYANKGGQVDASFITITGPNYKQMDKVAPIKQAFTVAIEETARGESEAIEAAKEAAEEAKKEGKKEEDLIPPSQVIQVLYRASSDITKVFLYAEQLFKSGAALVDGETKLTTPLMEKMHLDDFEGLVGAYISNFIAPSLMGGDEKDTD